MFALLRYSLPLFICLCTYTPAYANSIDSLITKEDVRKFLATAFEKKGIIQLNECAELYFPRDYPPLSFHAYDTVMIHDPVNDSVIVRVFPHDTAADIEKYEHRKDADCCIPGDLAFKYLDAEMDEIDWRFYKTDVDGNGRNDLIIDVGYVVVVLDKENGIEGHKVYCSHPNGFKGSTLLPGGNAALLLRQDRNTYSYRHTDTPGKVTYITYAMAGKIPEPPLTNIDTLYKITTGVEQFSSSFPATPYSDTIDMRMYNMTDTIVYKFGGFVPYMPNTKPATISKIGYLYFVSTDMSGDRFDGYTCMEVNKDGKCFLLHDGRMYVSPAGPYHAKDGLPVYTGILNSKKLKMLWDFTSHIDINSKDDSYSIETTHTFGGYFAIYFDDGTVKEISFLGDAPMELCYLSKALSNISKDMDWQRCEKNCDFGCLGK